MIKLTIESVNFMTKRQMSYPRVQRIQYQTQKYMKEWLVIRSKNMRKLKDSVGKIKMNMKGGMQCMKLIQLNFVNKTHGIMNLLEIGMLI